MTIVSSRRGFLKGAAAVSAGLVIGLRANGAMAAAPAADAQLTPFVRIDADGKVFAVVKHFEMGQGVSTGLTTLVAEELGLRMDQIGFDFAPSDPQVYNNLFFGPFQGTGGSTAMANSFMQYRTAGAAAREMLKAAAAGAWGVSASDLDIKDGVITGAGHEAPLAEFVAAAALMPVPEAPALRAPAEWRLIGRPGAVARKDTPGKVNGAARFATDMQLPGQRVAAIARPPRMGALATAVDDAAALALPGVEAVTILPGGLGVAVIADTTWHAFQGRDALDVTWDLANAESRSSDEVTAELVAALDAAPQYDAGGDLSATEAALAGAASVLERTFTFPLLAHAPMEPASCTIEPTASGGAILHDGAQFPTTAQITVAKMLGLDISKVVVNTLFAGGSFGRRANAESDYHRECAAVFTSTDRSRPVKLVWSREDDIRGGYYRPAFAHKVRVGLDAAGEIVAWDHRVAGQSILKGTFFEGVMVKDGIDSTSLEGVNDTPYAVPGMAVGLTDGAKATTVLWFRSVGHTHTAYVMESMIDIIAEETGQDPLALRLSLLPGDTPEQKRMAGVLKTLADATDWEKGAPEGRSRGLAVHHSFGSFVAEAVEISGGKDAPVKVEKVWVAVDCGLPVNPDVIRAQMEGGAGFGLGAVMRNAITLTGGEVDQSNFPDYEPLRISDIGAIEVAIIASEEAPTGVGEPGVPPAGPALASAIARAGGPRITDLPMADHVDFA